MGMMENKTRAQKIFQTFLFALSLGMLVYFCVSDDNLMILVRGLPKIGALWIVCAVFSVGVNWCMDSMVIHALVFGACGGGYRLGQAFRVTMVGQYFNSVTPYALGGQPMQFFTLLRQGVASGTAISTLVQKFLVFQSAITGYSLVVILVKYQFFVSKIQGFMALAFIGFLYQAASVVVLILFSFSPAVTTRLIRGAVWLLTKVRLVKRPEETSEKVRDQLKFFLESNRALHRNPLLMLRIYALTFVQLTALFLVPFFLYKAFHNPGAPVFDIIAAQSFVTMISGYTPLPGAAGAAEGSFLVIFQIFFAPEVIRQAMLLWRFIAYYSCILVGAFFAVPEQKHAARRSAGNRTADGAAPESGGMKHE